MAESKTQASDGRRDGRLVPRMDGEGVGARCYWLFASLLSLVYNRVESSEAVVTGGGFEPGVSMSELEAVLADACRLPVLDRIQLIEAIWDTMPTDELPPLTEEWIAMVHQRSAEYDAGAVQTVSWEEVKRDALRRVGITIPNAHD